MSNYSKLPDPEDLLSELAFRCPEIGPAISRVSVAWDETCVLNGQPSACVNAAGRILIHPALANVAIQVLAHEVMHLVGEHFIDMPAPRWDPMLANIAGDIWLNGILQDLIPALEWPKDWLYPADAQQRDMTARQLYETLASSARRGKVKLGAGCGIEGPRGEEGEDGQDPGPGGTGMDRATASAVMAGIGSVLPRVEGVITPPPPRCTITEVLREAKRGAEGNSSVRSTFARLGRRSTPMIPRRGRVKRGPALVVIVDVSGSMMGELDTIRRECVGLAKRAKVHLILHDCSVLFSGRVGRDRIADKIRPAGGTDFGAAFVEAARVIKAWGGNCGLVHFTDGEVGHWPPPPAPVPSYAGVTTQLQAPNPWRTRHITRAE